TKIMPESIHFGLGNDDADEEGRVLTVQYESFFLVNAYSPNSQRDLARLGFRLDWEDRLKLYLLELNEKKPVILCGDLNVAHQEIDLKNPRSNKGNSGFTDEERNKMTSLLDSGFIDSYRFFYPEQQGAYTWWSYMSKVRERNIGWRIDYFIVSQKLQSCLKNAHIHSSIIGSDHCPVVLEIELD
ncbi:MAG: exodeoxyribonuclease III, partial [Bacillota bacterium]|nr:exodeoxyribonuclease III [Bacillota bacterium]